MVKKQNTGSPKKGSAKGSPCKKFHNQMGRPDDQFEGLNDPHSNDDKKIINTGHNGSGQTDENREVENQRNDIQIPGFMSGSPQGENSNGTNNAGNNGLSGSSSSQVDEEEGVKKPRTNDDYVKFFKFYYQKTKSQHPKWNPGQITTIISLLWKKKKNSLKQQKTDSEGRTSRRSNKPLAPKDAFKIHYKSLSKEQQDQLWSKLPKQSKRYWRKEGDNYGSSARLSQISSVNNAGQNGRIPPHTHNDMRLLLNQV